MKSECYGVFWECATVTDMHVFTVSDVTRKVQNLRTYYARLIRESSKKKSRRGKRWQFFDQMEFLRDHIVLRMARPICSVRIILIFVNLLQLLICLYLQYLMSPGKFATYVHTMPGCCERVLRKS